MPKKSTAAKMTKGKNQMLKSLNQLQPHKLQQANVLLKMLKAANK
jgi:hypothetical protein